MRNLVIRLQCLALVLLAAMPLQAQYRRDVLKSLEDSETVASFKQHVGVIASTMMGGRAAGSEGELLTAEYVTETLKAYGVDVLSGRSGDPFGIKQENGDTLCSCNVCGFIQGNDKELRNRYIVIGARMDNGGTNSLMVDGQKVDRICYGANGNASGLAMMLELGRLLQTNRFMLRRSVLLIGFGASKEGFVGSWYFLNRSFSDVANIDAMIDLDMVGTANNGFYAYTSSNADLNAVVRSLEGELQPIRPTLTSSEPYPSDHRAFYDKGIPSVLFTTGQYPQHDTDKDVSDILDYKSMEKELEYVYNFSLALAGGPKPIFNPSETVRSMKNGGVIPYYDCEVMPSFYGSTDPRFFLQKWVYTYMKYPKEAVRQGIQGRVLVEFVIDENGKVGDVTIVKGSDPLLDYEAERIISASPSWKPGRVDGRKVKASMSLYIDFRLEKNNSKKKR